MKQYEKFEFSIIMFHSEDVVTVSLGGIGPETSDDAAGDFEW
jgi:hypothetical protein